MKDTKLIKVIEKFSKTDLKRMKEFVHSPFFRASKTERDLFDFIYKYAPDFDHKKFTPEQAAKYIFTDKKYDASALIKIQSRLFKLVELFIYYYFRDENLPDVEVALMKFYDRENLTSQVETTYKKIQKKQEAYPHRDFMHYFNQLTIEKQYKDFLVGKFEDGKGNTHYQKVMEILDIFYLTEKLIQICQLYNRQMLTNVNYEVKLMDEILAFLPDSDYKDVPIIKIWYTALSLLHSADKYEHYRQLKTLLIEHNSLLNQRDKRALYTYLENNTSMVFESDAYYKALFDLYSRQLEDATIYIDGYLLPTIFKNIVTVGLRLEHLEWTEQFLENNKDKIVPEYEDRDDVYSYSLAQLYFKQQKIDDVLDVLNRTVFNDIYIKMDIRRMYLKVYYEMKYDDMLEDMVNSFRVFLTSHQDTIPAIHIQAHRDFINVIYNIYRTMKKDKKRIEAMENQIAEINILPEKSWLLEKLDTLR